MMNDQVCEQCHINSNATDKRLIKDSCGHIKCINCLIIDIKGCRVCLKKKTEETGHFDLTSHNSKQLPLSGNHPSHIATDTDDKGIFYVCKVCNKNFRTRENIAYHIYCNGLTKPYHCTECNKYFSSFSHYQYHMRVHNNDRPYICDICNSGFFQQSKLRRHMLKHSGEKKFQCECGVAFNNRCSLRKHSHIHSGLKPHPCVTCGALFRDSSNLRKHTAKHDNKKYICKYCSQELSTYRSFVTHIRTHIENRNYQCQHCRQAFYSKKDLRRHIAIHSEIKPFRCSVCSRKFKRKDNLDRHVRNTHADEGSNCVSEMVSVQLNEFIDADGQKSQDNSSNNNLLVDEHQSNVSNTVSDTNVDKSTKDMLQKDCLKTMNDTELFSNQSIYEANNSRKTVIFGPINLKKDKIEKIQRDENIQYIHKKVDYARLAHQKLCDLPPIPFERLEMLKQSNLELGPPPKNFDLYKKILCDRDPPKSEQKP